MSEVPGERCVQLGMSVGCLQTLPTHTGQLDTAQMQTRSWWPHYTLLRCKATLAHLVKILMRLHQFLVIFKTVCRPMVA